MPRLHISLFGAFQVLLEHEPATAFESTKVRALLAYLAVESERAHTRESLAGLLWPDYPERRARRNLSQALFNLREVIGDRAENPPHLLTTRQVLRFNPDSSHQIDVYVFSDLLDACTTHDHDRIERCDRCLDRMEQAIEVYQGDFLDGFSVDSAPAEEWIVLKREHYHQLALGTLHKLTDYYEQRGEYEPALQHARLQVELEPWREAGHQQLMRLLARAGRRTAALRQYEDCVRILDDELGVTPASETILLYEQIQTGNLEPVQTHPPRFYAPNVPDAQRPSFLESGTTVRGHDPDVFVGRERQLADLDAHLAAARAGQGRIVFVTGEAGRGKTALLTAFARRAQEQHPDLIVATGTCTAHFGVGDPYLPFCDVLDMLTGAVEHPMSTGRLTHEQARRAWKLAPDAIEAILDSGADLIDVMVSGSALTRRAAAVAPDADGWVQQVHDRVTQAANQPEDGKRYRLFEQYTQVLHTLAGRQPVLLILDDLQWVDSGSLGLLFHLGRRLPGCQILVLGAYRPSDVRLDGAAAADAYAGEPQHPLQPVVNELVRRFGDIRVDLDAASHAEERQFVDALVDSQPNRLDDAFRAELFQRTKGHTLFTIELLRVLQERGDLLRDDDERWIVAPTLAWDLLPARIEAVIAQRIGRLPANLQDMLRAASVEGETFSVQVLAQVQGVDEQHVLRRLSQQVEQRHRLVRERGDVTIGQRRLTQYRFSHHMFQQYLYNSLSTGERRLLHREVAGALEALYAEETDDVAVQLAHHYTEAEEGEQAVPYLLRAGDRARDAYAHQEAIDHYHRALDFLRDQRAYDRAARILMKLGQTYHTAFQFKRAREAYEEGFSLWQRGGTRRTADVPVAPHALRLAWSELSSIDPAVHSDASSSAVVTQLFGGLVSLNSDMDVVPDIARRWDVLDDRRTYVFHLRDDVRWSDGTLVTADDFEYAWKRMLAPTNSSFSAQLFYDIKGALEVHRGDTADHDAVGVRAVDEHTFVVELEGPTGYFLQLLTHPASYVVPRHIVERYGDSWTDVGKVVTCGPFRLDAWQRGASMSLRRNPDYHGRVSGNVEQIKLTLGLSDSAKLAMYEADHLDVIWLAPEMLDPILSRYAEEYVSAPLLASYYAEFNVNRSPFDDARVRRALALAVDTTTLADVVLKGHVVPATGGFLPPGMPGHSPGSGVPYDPERARRLLARAGYPDGRGFPDCYAIATDDFSHIGAYLREQWQEVLEIELSWIELEYTEYHRTWKTRRPHVGLPSGWRADIADPDNFLRVALYHYTLWRHADYEKLIGETRRLTDQEKRMQLYRQAENILLSETPIIPLYHQRLHMLMKPWVSTYPTTPKKWCFWKDVVIEPH